MISEIISKIVLQILMVACFIGVFFFTYGAYIERSVFKDQMNYIVDELVGELSVITPKYLGPTIKNQIANLKMPDMSDADRKTEENNKKLLKLALPILIGSVVVGIIFALVMSYVFGFEFAEIMLLNLVALFAVAITEFSFVTFSGKNFRSADPNYVKKTVFQTLKDFSEE